MPDPIEIVGLPQLEQNLRSLQREVFPDAAVRAVNRVATTLRSRTTKSIASHMGLKQKDVRDRIVVSKARRGGAPTAELRITGRPLNLIKFKGKQLKSGVSASPWGSRKKYPAAFIATMPNGAEIVVIRASRGGQRVARLPIRSMYGPGIANSANDPGVVRERAEVVEERMPIELKSQIDYLVSRLRR